MKTPELTADHATTATSHALTSRELAIIGIPQLIGLLDELEGRTWSPWAILLVRFSDDKDPSPPLTKYQDLFTAQGSGSSNMVDFFRDMSHGKIDVSGSRVFGWYTLPAKRGDYVGNVYPQPAGKLNRDGVLSLAKNVAESGGVKLSDFSGVIVSGFQRMDLCGWVGGMAALCDSFSLVPSLLGQEMGHGYGLDHARLEGSASDYMDPWDVMSTAHFPSMEAPNGEFSFVGPGLNAWNMRSRGWLDESRVWTSSAADADARVQLRPLHRLDMPGFLAAQIGQYLVEFRVPERWDAAIPRACVLVHRFQDNHSYLMPAYDGSQDLVEGDKFAVGDRNFPLLGYHAVEVESIDPQTQTATLRVHQHARRELPSAGVTGQLLGGVAVDGGGLLIVAGQVHIVPPRSPAIALMAQVARYVNVSTYESGVDAALSAQRDALTGIVRAAIALHAEARSISDHPPGYRDVAVSPAPTRSA